MKFYYDGKYYEFKHVDIKDLEKFRSTDDIEVLDPYLKDPRSLYELIIPFPWLAYYIGEVQIIHGSRLVALNPKCLNFWGYTYQEKVLSYLAEMEPSAFSRIEELPEELYLKLIAKEKLVINYISNPTDSLWRFAFSLGFDPFLLDQKKLTARVLKIAVKYNIKALGHYLGVPSYRLLFSLRKNYTYLEILSSCNKINKKFAMEALGVCPQCISKISIEEVDEDMGRIYLKYTKGGRNLFYFNLILDTLFSGEEQLLELLDGGYVDIEEIPNEYMVYPKLLPLVNQHKMDENTWI